MAESVFTPVIEGIKLVQSEDGEMLARPFLDACKHILPVIDNFGASMALVKSDIGDNITRLENKYDSDPVKFKYLYNMVQVEVETNTAKGSLSCTNGLLWLTRAMDFVVQVFRGLLEHPDWTMSQVSTDAYSKTLKKVVAMKLAPDRKEFMEVVGGDAVKTDIKNFLAAFAPVLQQNHKFLARVGLDDMKAT